MNMKKTLLAMVVMIATLLSANFAVAGTAKKPAPKKAPAKAAAKPAAPKADPNAGTKKTLAATAAETFHNTRWNVQQDDKLTKQSSKNRSQDVAIAAGTRKDAQQDARISKLERSDASQQNSIKWLKETNQGQDEYLKGLDPRFKNVAAAPSTSDTAKRPAADIPAPPKTDGIGPIKPPADTAPKTGSAATPLYDKAVAMYSADPKGICGFIDDLMKEPQSSETHLQWIQGMVTYCQATKEGAEKVGKAVNEFKKKPFYQKFLSTPGDILFDGPLCHLSVKKQMHGNKCEFNPTLVAFDYLTWRMVVNAMPAKWADNGFGKNRSVAPPPPPPSAASNPSVGPGVTPGPGNSTADWQLDTSAVQAGNAYQPSASTIDGTSLVAGHYPTGYQSQAYGSVVRVVAPPPPPPMN